VTEDEEPTSTGILNAQDFVYVFVVDRSGSMSGRRIEITKEAVTLFIQSLPFGSAFDIISFGSGCTSMADPNNILISPAQYFLYNEKNVEIALAEISKFKADMGSTNLGEALYLANRKATICPEK
jgi:von Willebrand factor A domain-containing protein 5